jgi:hypothetical protein
MILKNELLASFCAHASGDLKRSPIYDMSAPVVVAGSAPLPGHRP